MLFKSLSILALFALPLVSADYFDDSTGEFYPNDVPELVVTTIGCPATCEIKTRANDVLSMNYVGRLFGSRKKFDSSYDRHQAFNFTLGVGQVINGWDEGLAGMCIGEQRNLIIPSRLAYGPDGLPAAMIPAHTALIFDVQLMGFTTTTPAPKSEL
ncbi:hypothetical protein BOTBODRAFT_452341 [Botryobasidium botryosum FD-172 SS1]|uniref:peptidylprolyl isomerase n=1 Tax=Botryobasidium botryosum (strain FD-172 SS1) TaxID=930990 RepID=A0A067MI38_BOTB1|nr:hypothetical protein BOTBODRAFT_452341 [Botryobasidium botryosum FD-172 SS1]